MPGRGAEDRSPSARDDDMKYIREHSAGQPRMIALHDSLFFPALNKYFTDSSAPER